MMRSVLILLMLGLCVNAQAQTWEEWTQQKKLAIQRLREQIAANKVYIDYAKKGYRLVNNGLQTIHKIKERDYSLHLGFFDSLLRVNPRIKLWGKVAEILQLQLKLIGAGKGVMTAMHESAQLKLNEQNYIRQVVDRMAEASGVCLDELFLLLGAEPVRLSDDERIHRIDQLFTDMQDKLAFMSSFHNEVAVLALQRLTEQTEINYSKKLRE